jgi:hypothetical protein
MPALSLTLTPRGSEGGRKSMQSDTKWQRERGREGKEAKDPKRARNPSAHCMNGLLGKSGVPEAPSLLWGRWDLNLPLNIRMVDKLITDTSDRRQLCGAENLTHLHSAGLRAYSRAWTAWPRPTFRLHLLLSLALL